MGMERCARQVLLVLSAELNAELDAQAAAWASLDQELATARGLDYVPADLEHVLPGNFVPGHRPSLLEASVDNYPNVSVMGYRKRPGGGDQDMDLYWGVNATVAVELMVKAGPYSKDDVSGAGEELVNRRVQRTAEAALNVLARHPNLDGIVEQITSPPVAGITDVFVRTELGSDNKWFWQAARIELSIPHLVRAY
jgi:hypothetical protein